MEEASKNTDLNWLSGGGEMAAIISSMDWSKTPLGPIRSWPQSLRTTVSLCLASNFPIDIIWGPEFIQIYNVGYRVICGASHPRALGEPFTATWVSAWPVIGEAFYKGLAGETSFLENQRIFIERNGYLEETFFTFSFSPIRDENGEVAGLFHPVTETSATMLNDRRARALGNIATNVTHAETVQEAAQLILNSLAEYQRDLPFLMLYEYSEGDQKVRCLGNTGGAALSQVAVEEMAITSAKWPFSEVLDTAQTKLVTNVETNFGIIPCGEYPESTSEAFVMPIKASGRDRPVGFAVIGLSTRLAFDQSYRSFLETLVSSISGELNNARAYEEKQRKADELAALDRAKTAFFSNVSHEFRTPLTLMLGPLEASLKDQIAPLSPAQRERQELTFRNALRLLKLVNTLLDFSRIQAGRIDAIYRPTDLASLTAEIASVFRSAIETAGLAFKVHVGKSDELVYVDRGMWEKIVLNLLSNAFKFTFEGEIELSFHIRGKSAVLKVRDSGTGIPESEIPLLFHRFHRVEGARGRTYEGSGIGLSLIQELVNIHGGSVEVKSTMGMGSEFIVTVPLGSKHLPKDRISNQTASGALGSLRAQFVEEVTSWLPEIAQVTALGLKESFETALNSSDIQHTAVRSINDRPRILVADDNADMRLYLKDLLNSNFDVHLVKDGAEALNQISKQLPDLILADVMMPKLDGFGLLKAIRADSKFQNIPFLLLSARAGEESRIEGLERGADEYLVKPFSARELLARVTSQLKLAQARREVETERSTLHDFFMQAPVPLVIFSGPEHEFKLANPPYNEFIGRNPIGRKVREVFTDEEAGGFFGLLDNVYKTGIPYTGNELLFRQSDENGVLHDKFINIGYHPFRESDGKIKGILAVVLDQTEQVLARKSIEASEEKLRALADSVPAMLTVLNPDGSLEYANKTQLEYFGKDIAFMKKGEWATLYHPDEYESVIQDLESHLKAGKTWISEFRLRRKDGAYRWHLSRLVPYRDAAGTILKWYGTNADVHDQRLQAEELLNTQSNLQLALESAKMGSWYLDIASQKLTYSNSLNTLFGIENPVEDLAAFIEKHVLPDDREAGIEALRRVLQDRDDYLYKFRIFDLNGDMLHIISKGKLLFGRNNEPYALTGILIDVTEQARLEEQLRSAKEEAERANSLKSSFLANMSHEIRTPLGAILGFSALLKERTTDPAERDHFVDTILRNGSALTRIIDDILDLAKVEAGKLEIEKLEFSIYDLATETVDLFKDKAREKGIHLLLGIDENVPPKLCSDPTRLRQILINLIGNAVKFTDDGSVRVNIRSAKAPDGLAVVSVDVKDTGIGLTEDQKQKLFQPFIQADNSTTRRFGGTGLGLVLSQRLAHALGGKIEIADCAHGKGCTFNLTFTAAILSDKKRQTTSSYAKGTDNSLHGVRVLLVDDSVDNRYLVKRLLTKHGAEVDTATDGREGFDFAVRGSHDLILMDIQMPNMDGYQAKRALDNQGYSKPVIALTAHAMEEEQKKTLEAGFAGHLTKPLNNDELLKTVALLAEQNKTSAH
jgi:PAS domain S-box-containing protein